jgi:hypothetical protein
MDQGDLWLLLSCALRARQGLGLGGVEAGRVGGMAAANAGMLCASYHACTQVGYLLYTTVMLLRICWHRVLSYQQFLCISLVLVGD